LASNILESIRDRLRREMNDVVDDVGTGGALSEESADLIAVKYAKQVGVLEGLARAERTIIDCVEEAEKRETEDT